MSDVFVDGAPYGLGNTPKTWGELLEIEIQRGDSADSSCPAASSSAYCSAVGRAGDPIRLHASYELLC